MLTLPSKKTEFVKAVNVKISNGILHISLSDGREISIPFDRIEWLNWLSKAAPEQQNNWSIEGGFAIYWEDLDDGVEICHLLSAQSMTKD